MRDGVAIFKAGHPVVVVVQTNFENAARAQAKIQGVPNLKMLVIPHVNVNLPKAEQAAEEAAIAESATQQLPAMIEYPH